MLFTELCMSQLCWTLHKKRVNKSRLFKVQDSVSYILQIHSYFENWGFFPDEIDWLISGAQELRSVFCCLLTVKSTQNRESDTVQCFTGAHFYIQVTHIRSGPRYVVLDLPHLWSLAVRTSHRPSCGFLTCHFPAHVACRHHPVIVWKCYHVQSSVLW